MVDGGFYIKARCAKDSFIAKAPPHVREIWDWLLMNANFKDNGKLKRGQVLTTYSEILEDLSWFVGYRKVAYKKHNCETAMKLLTKEKMVTATKTTRGLIVTICNYDKYQDIKNYESRTETDSESDNETTVKPHDKGTNEKEGKEELKDSCAEPQKAEVKAPKNRNGFSFAFLTEESHRESIDDFIDHRKAKKSTMTQKALELNYKSFLKCADHFNTSFSAVVDFVILKGWLSPNTGYMENAGFMAAPPVKTGTCPQCRHKTTPVCIAKDAARRVNCKYFEMAEEAVA